MCDWIYFFSYLLYEILIPTGNRVTLRPRIILNKVILDARFDVLCFRQGRGYIGGSCGTGNRIHRIYHSSSAVGTPIQAQASSSHPGVAAG